MGYANASFFVVLTFYYKYGTIILGDNMNDLLNLILSIGATIFMGFVALFFGFIKFTQKRSLGEHL